MFSMCILFVRVGEICANTSSLLNMKYVLTRTPLMQLRIAETVVPWYYDVSVTVLVKLKFLLLHVDERCSEKSFYCIFTVLREELQ